jgi:hypothetical protein
MLNWKRYSDSSRKKSITQAIPLDLPESRPSSQITVVDLKSVTENAVAKEENKEAEENENTVKDLNQDNVEKKRTNVLKEKINDEKNNIDKNDEEKIQKEKKEEEELSEPDKLALRQEAEKLLSGFSDTSAKEIPTFSFSSDFSKSLDDVWNTDSLDMVTVKDPRDVGIKISIDLVSDDEEVKNTATLLWKEDESVVERSKMAEWLGQG